MSGAELATKADLNALGGALRSEMAQLRSELKGEMTGLRGEVKTDLELLRRDMTIRLGGMMVLGVGVMVTAMRLMLLHP
jgi:hypothetical protein